MPTELGIQGPTAFLATEVLGTPLPSSPSPPHAAPPVPIHPQRPAQGPLPPGTQPPGSKAARSRDKGDTARMAQQEERTAGGAPVGGTLRGNEQRERRGDYPVPRRATAPQSHGRSHPFLDTGRPNQDPRVSVYSLWVIVLKSESSLGFSKALSALTLPTDCPHLGHGHGHGHGGWGCRGADRPPYLGSGPRWSRS